MVLHTAVSVCRSEWSPVIDHWLVRVSFKLFSSQEFSQNLMSPFDKRLLGTPVQRLSAGHRGNRWLMYVFPALVSVRTGETFRTVAGVSPKDLHTPRLSPKPWVVLRSVVQVLIPVHSEHDRGRHLTGDMPSCPLRSLIPSEIALGLPPSGFLPPLTSVTPGSHFRHRLLTHCTPPLPTRLTHLVCS